MASVMAAYSDDTEAKVLSALITSANFDPTDKNYTNQLKAAAILEPLFKEYPKHPGVAHYLIHSYDYPPIAEKGLSAAKAYAAIAPDAPHALHMPSHIFTRVGYWKESIAANRESWRVSGEKVFDGHHATDYMVYAHLQLAQDAAARQAMAASVARPAVDNFGAAFAYAAMPARLLLEAGDWAGAATLPWTRTGALIPGRSTRRPRRSTPLPAALALPGAGTAPRRATNRRGSSPCAMRRRPPNWPTGQARSTSRPPSSAPWRFVRTAGPTSASTSSRPQPRGKTPPKSTSSRPARCCPPASCWPRPCWRRASRLIHWPSMKPS